MSAPANGIGPSTHCQIKGKVCWSAPAASVCAALPPHRCGYPAVLATMIHVQVQLLRAIQATIGELKKLIKELIAVHPRTQLLAALPGVGQINLAQLLAEVGPILMGVDIAEHAPAARHLGLLAHQHAQEHPPTTLRVSPARHDRVHGRCD